VVIGQSFSRRRHGGVWRGKFSNQRAIHMDKKAKKRTQLLQQRIQTLRQQLSGAKKQVDEPDELRSIERQLAAAEAELAKVKDS
jgi:uncharacterized protein (DUF342 family)